MFVFHEDEDNDISDGLVGRAANMLNTTRDIAYMIWIGGEEKVTVTGLTPYLPSFGTLQTTAAKSVRHGFSLLSNFSRLSWNASTLGNSKAPTSADRSTTFRI